MRRGGHEEGAAVQRRHGATQPQQDEQVAELSRARFGAGRIGVRLLVGPEAGQSQCGAGEGAAQSLPQQAQAVGVAQDPQDRQVVAQGRIGMRGPAAGFRRERVPPQGDVAGEILRGCVACGLGAGAGDRLMSAARGVFCPVWALVVDPANAPKRPLKGGRLRLRSGMIISTL